MPFTNQARIVCKCGGQHGGTVVAVLGNDSYGVAWDAMLIANRPVKPEFADAHIKTLGHNVSIKGDEMNLE